MANTQQKFQPQETLLWETVEGQTPTRRMVSFERYEPGGDIGIVQFMHTAEGAPRRWSVRLSELSRPVAPSNVPIYHQHAFKPPTPPKPLSSDQIEQRLVLCRDALEAAHAHAKQAGEVVAGTKQLVDRARGEHEAARGQLLGLEAATASAARQYEAAIRAADPAPEIAPAPDRAAIVTRVTLTAAVLDKLSREHQEAQQRLNSAVAGIRHKAIDLITALLEKDIAQLRELDEYALQFRADLTKVVQWAGASGTPLRLSEAANSALSNLPDLDRVRFMGSAAVGPWERLLERLLDDPAADFSENPASDSESQAA